MAEGSADIYTDIVVTEANVHDDDAHILEIPEDQGQIKITPSDSFSSPADSPQHPLDEIADSRGHLLLLKLWQRDKDILGRHIEAKESKIESIRREIFQFACLFFAFHGIGLTLLFTAASNPDTCTRWWIPATLFFIASLVPTCAMQHSLVVQGKVVKTLQGNRARLRAVGRCMQELRMKGISFDLAKQPHPPRRWKSSSVETKLGPLRLCSQFSPSIVFTVISPLFLWSCKLIACS